MTVLRDNGAMAEQDPPRLADMIATSAWWPHVSDDQRRRVLSEVEERRYTGGSVVMRKGETVEAWTGVVEGLIKINVVSQAGKSATFTGIGPGGWFGEGSLLKDEPRKYDVVALRDSRIAWMPRATFDWLLDNSIPFNRFLLVQLNERLGQFIGMVEYERLLEPDARVARCLAELFNPLLYPGHREELEISQEEIGYLSGVSRQRVNQALQVLAREGLLSVEYGLVRIRDLPRLRRYGN
jgi:CRP/FNR family cyclic AMP-dependent transcriptional regulator